MFSTFLNIQLEWKRGSDISSAVWRWTNRWTELESLQHLQTDIKWLWNTNSAHWADGDESDPTVEEDENKSSYFTPSHYLTAAVFQSPSRKIKNPTPHLWQRCVLCVCKWENQWETQWENQWENQWETTASQQTETEQHPPALWRDASSGTDGGKELEKKESVCERQTWKCSSGERGLKVQDLKE